MAANVTGWRSADNSIPSSPATEVDYLFKVQVIIFCRLFSVCRNKSPNKEPKVDERFPSARIFANLHVIWRFLSVTGMVLRCEMSKMLLLIIVKNFSCENYRNLF